jgi:chromosome transmission fidelity protein 4
MRTGGSICHVGYYPSIHFLEQLFYTFLALCSKVVCVLLNSWDGSKEWSVDLPEGEEALAVAAGKGWIAVATDTRNLRLFTVTGTQREVVSLPGPIVCVAGYRKRLLTVFHNGMGKLYH